MEFLYFVSFIVFGIIVFFVFSEYDDLATFWLYILSSFWTVVFITSKIVDTSNSREDQNTVSILFAIHIIAVIIHIFIRFILPAFQSCKSTFDSFIKKKYRIAQERIAKKNIEKQISIHTKEIKKQSKYIQKDIKKYSELSEFSTCTVKDISDISNIIDLFTTINSRLEKDFKVLLEPYLNCAKQKKEIEDKVKYVAALYKEIGNEKAAQDLLRTIQQTSRINMKTTK